MTEVKVWTESDRAQIDRTFGYNDILVTTYERPGGDKTWRAVDDVSEGVLAQESQEIPPTLEQLQGSGIVQAGDQVFRYGQNGPFIIRRSIFIDRCEASDVAENHIFTLTEAETRAVAYFTLDGESCDDTLDVTYVNGRLDPKWCEDTVHLTSEDGPRQMVTPWDLNDNAQLEKLETAAERIRKAQKDGCKDPLGKELAAAVSEEQLSKLEDAIAKKKDDNKSAADKILDQPWYKWAGGTAAVVAAFHYGGKALGFLDSKVAGFFRGKGGGVGAAAAAVITVGAVLMSPDNAQAAEPVPGVAHPRFQPPSRSKGDRIAEALLENALCVVSFGFLCSSEAY